MQNGCLHSVVFDHARTARIGLPEAVFCQSKTPEVIAALMTKAPRKTARSRGDAAGAERPLLFTRLSGAVFSSLPAKARAGVDYHELSQTAFTGILPKRPKGRVAVVSAGTSDGPVAWEAARTLEYLGIAHTLFEDSGVAGLWRLTSRMDDIKAHDVVIAVAGMDAALASVLGGLVACPVVAVPTSVGYGMTRAGETALASMLVSCAPGIAVMNIDNGYGAACAAARVVNLLCA